MTIGIPERHRGAARFLRWLPQRSRALVLKDIREFIRETAQWIQVAVILSLLLLYTLNIRNLGYDVTNPFWLSVINLLNFTVCALALSTLTTRFVFPQFSLEGHRLWILGMAPFGLDRVLIQKLALNVAFTGGAAGSLILVSGLLLELPARQHLIFLYAIALLSFGLNAIALSLGTVFPNFDETNPAKIVSGFGGTLCLISSFLYIALFIAIVTFANLAPLLPGGPQALRHFPLAPDHAMILGTLLLTVTFGGLPLFLAINRVKRLELLGKL